MVKSGETPSAMQGSSIAPWWKDAVMQTGRLPLKLGLQEAAGMAFTLTGKMHQEWGGGARRPIPLVKELPIICTDTTFPAFFMLPLRISQKLA